MGIETVVNSVFGNRVTYGTTLELQDGNLLIEDQLFPNRVALIGACSNSERDPDNSAEYLIPTNQPTPIAKLEDLAFLRNGDPDDSPSELLLAFRDAYEGGARTFEVVIISRSVVQLGANITSTDTIIPVNSIYTGKVSRMVDFGAHPTANEHFASFEHNGMLFVAGGERPDTPAVGDITSAVKGSYITGDYMTFTHTDARVHGFWFDLTGTDTIPAALAAAVAAGTAGSVATIVDINGATSENEVAILLAAAVETDSALPITAYENTTDVEFESDEAGVLGNSWTIAEVGTGVTVNAGMATGAATNTISTRLFKQDPATDLWSNVLDTAGTALRLVVGTRDAGACHETATVINITGGMVTIEAATGTSVETADAITFTSAILSTAAVSVGPPIITNLTTLGEALFVRIGLDSYYIFGGNTATGASAPSRSDMVATFTPSSGAAIDTTDNLPAATRWLGGYHEPVSDRIYVFGGETSDGAIDTTSVYDIGTTDFLAAGTAGRMTQKKYAFGYSEINGAAYVFGGHLASGESDKIDRFDPDSLTWSNRDSLVLAASGGGVVKIADRLYYADDIQGGKYNVGIGNLDDQFVGFPLASTLAGTPFFVQLEWEIMHVTSYTTTRLGGRDTDAFAVTRAQRTSTAIAHLDRADLTHDPEVLHTQLSDAFEVMAGLSQADYILMPWRATADCPYLTATKNFAHLAGFYCVFKTSQERTVMGMLGVHPPNENPRVEYTRTEETAWVGFLNDFDRLNYESVTHWSIGDGVTDADSDTKPDTYALWFVKDGSIPTGAPPMDSGSVELDRNKRPIDMGKHLVIIAAYGFATSREYAEKYPSAGRGYLRSGHAQFAGMLSVLDAALGSTGAPARGFIPVRPLTLLDENNLIGKRYVIVVQRTNGFRWSNGFTFAYNVSASSRSDWVFASSVRRASALTRAIRRIVDIYAGKGTDRQTQTAMDVDIAQKIQNFVGAGVVGPRTTHRTEIDQTDAIMGHARIFLSIHIPGELMNIDMIAALTV